MNSEALSVGEFGQVGWGKFDQDSLGIFFGGNIARVGILFGKHDSWGAGQSEGVTPCRMANFTRLGRSFTPSFCISRLR